MSAMPESLVKVRCPRCGHTWYEDMEQLIREEPHVIAKGLGQGSGQPAGELEFDRRCIQCGTHVVVRVKKDE